MQTSEVAQRYAAALFTLAQEQGALTAVHKDFRAFSEIARKSKDLIKLLDSPAFGRDDKVAALGTVAQKAGYSATFSKFLGVMARNGRTRDILGAEVAFDQLYARQRGVKRAVVRTAKEMSATERARIESLVARFVGGEIELTSEVDAGLIGGIQLRIGSRLIDASISAKLNRMNTAMKGA